MHCAKPMELRVESVRHSPGSQKAQFKGERNQCNEKSHQQRVYRVGNTQEKAADPASGDRGGLMERQG